MLEIQVEVTVEVFVEVVGVMICLLPARMLHPPC